MEGGSKLSCHSQEYSVRDENTNPSDSPCWKLILNESMTKGRWEKLNIKSETMHYNNVQMEYLKILLEKQWPQL